MTAKREVLNAVKNKLVDACIIVTVTVAMLLALELAARLLNYARVVHGRNDSPTVQKQEWGKQHLEDGEAIAWRYVPYVEFREKAYVSLTINLDSKGRRLVPGSCEKAHAITIWTFGGSTMVGYGAPDQFTIPAYLAVIFNRDGQCIRLVNYGAGGWQSTQSRIQLTQSLARGGRPDSVIFYDGINDVDILTLGRRPGGIAREAETLMAQAFDEHLGLPSQIARHSTLIRILMNRVYKTAQKHRDEERSRIGADIPAA